jgi:diguanylate cyclase (GGDEF)-like protein
VPLCVLALGYGLTAAVMLPYMLFYRGLWPQLAKLLSADAQTSSWLYVEWHVLFVATAIVYFIVRHRAAQQGRNDPAAFLVARRTLLWLAVAIFVVTVPAFVWIGGLPTLIHNGTFSPLFVSLLGAVAIAALGAIVLAYRTRQFEALLGVWLSVACFSMFADVMTTMFSHQFAAGWYLSRLSILLAASSVLLALLFQTATLYEQLAATAERLRTESLTDVLTGLANRRRFDVVIGEAMREATRTKRPLALLMIDIDNFKVYNDTFGHQGGDACLRKVAAVLQQKVGRARDLVARIGGEEIAVIMPEVDMGGALVVAERLRAAVAALAIPQGDASVHRTVTVSIGATATIDSASTTIAALVAAGDRALYRAKAAGRNRVAEESDLGVSRFSPIG